MKLALGTAQFGMNYGATNRSGQVSFDEVAAILKLAEENCIEILDTAFQYGESEEILGRALGDNQSFKIVTKTPSFMVEKIEPAHVVELERVFRGSLAKLGRKSVYGLLIHNAPDLMADKHRSLVELLERLKAEGVVAKVGVSVYNTASLDTILAGWCPDIVQLPLNVLDQRMLQGEYLRRLAELDVEIHVRSVFLQGVLLEDPAKLNPWFEPVRGLLDGYRKFLSMHGLTPLEGALAMVAGVKEIDYVLVGVLSTSQVREILSSLNHGKLLDFSPFACDNEQIINPSLWRLS
ncbi:MAG: aldo/keto reductase [Cyanobacteria bacterium HKST-UBA02]|nr:aldo/keto reductase [Cyanobacteria bacterium HKST-UBA02]